LEGWLEEYLQKKGGGKGGSAGGAGGGELTTTSEVWMTLLLWLVVTDPCSSRFLNLLRTKRTAIRVEPLALTIFRLFLRAPQLKRFLADFTSASFFSFKFIGKVKTPPKVTVFVDMVTVVFNLNSYYILSSLWFDYHRR
jgi:hypothetical protein